MTQTGQAPKEKTDKDRVDRQDEMDKTDRQDKAKVKLSLVQTDSDKDKKARQTALNYFRDNKKFPTYRQLGDMVGISKDKAGKIIRDLKENAG